MSKVNERNFITVQGWMVTELELKGNDLLVYAIIRGFSQTDNQKYTGSLQYLADWTRSTKQGVQKNLKNLLERGLIAKEEKFFNGVKFVAYYATELHKGMQLSCTEGMQLSCTNNIDTNTKLNNKDLCSFEEFWKEYPRKIGKPKAEEAYKKALKNGATEQQIIDGLKNVKSKQWDKWEEDRKQYIPHPTTWLNQCRWTDEVDEYVPKQSYKKVMSVPDYMLDAELTKTQELSRDEIMAETERMRKVLNGQI